MLLLLRAVMMVMTMATLVHIAVYHEHPYLTRGARLKVCFLVPASKHQSQTGWMHGPHVRRHGWASSGGGCSGAGPLADAFVQRSKLEASQICGPVRV